MLLRLHHSLDGGVFLIRRDSFGCWVLSGANRRADSVCFWGSDPLVPMSKNPSKPTFCAVSHLLVQLGLSVQSRFADLQICRFAGLCLISRVWYPLFGQARDFLGKRINRESLIVKSGT